MKLRGTITATLVVLAAGLALGATAAQATPFCYKTVAPNTRCTPGLGPFAIYHAWAHYDGAANPELCVRVEKSNGQYKRNCSTGSPTVTLMGCNGSYAYVGNGNNVYSYYVKGEEYDYGGSGGSC